MSADNPAVAQPPGHTRPFKPVEVSQVAWEQLIAQQAATHQLLDAHKELVELIAKIQTPAQLETVVLTPSAPVWESRDRFEAPVRSVGVLNPNNINVYFSGVGTAGAGARSPSAPPNSLIVLPISAQMIEVGANPADLGANTAVVFLMRFQTVQPAYLGKGA